jgi:hypothetical protein
MNVMNYLALISRPDFSNLYKFGRIYLPNLVPYDGVLKKHANDRELFDVVTKYINFYEYDTEYLLLDIVKNVSTDAVAEVSINELKGLYALSEKAKQSLQVSLDHRIYIQVSDWSGFFSDQNIEQAIRQAKAGVSNCYKIFGISAEEITKVKKVLPSNLIEEVYNDVFSRIRPTEDASLWNYLIRYERHFPYWNDKRGFFLDAVHVFENKRNRAEIDYEVADEKPIGDVIASCAPTSYDPILKRVEVFAQNDYKIDDCRYLVVASLYLYLKSEFKEGGITATKFAQLHEIITYLHNQYGADFAIAIALLGISLGYDLTYNYFYEINKVGIFSFVSDDEPDITDRKSVAVIEEMSKKIYYLQSLLNERDSKIATLSDKISELQSKLDHNMPLQEGITEDTKVEQPDNAEISFEKDLSEEGGEHQTVVEVIQNEDESPLSTDDNECLSPEVPTEEVVEHTESYDDSHPQDVEISIQTTGFEANPSFENLNDTATVETPIEPFEAVEMRKLNRNRRSFNQKVKSKWAHTKEEFDKFTSEGFAPINYFDREAIFPNNI